MTEVTSIGTVDTGGSKALFRNHERGGGCDKGERSMIFSFGGHDISNAI